MGILHVFVLEIEIFDGRADLFDGIVQILSGPEFDIPEAGVFLRNGCIRFADLRPAESAGEEIIRKNDPRSCSEIFARKIHIAGAVGITTVGLQLFDIDLAGARPVDQLAVMLISQAAMLPVVMYALVRGHLATRGGLRRFGLGLGRPKVTVIMTVGASPVVILLTFATLVAVTLMLNLLGYEPPPIAHDALRAIVETDRPDIFWGLVVSAVMVAPVVEEIIFRAFLQTTLRQSGLVRGRWAAIGLASVLFTAIHFGADSWHALPGLFVLSLGLGYVYERSGSVWPSIALHASFNALNVAMVVAGWVSQT